MIREEKVNELYGGTQKRKFISETITAEQARVRALSAAKIKAENELMPIFSRIDEACRNGLFSIDYSGNLSVAATDRLSELGYKCSKIESQQAIDEDVATNSIRISWEK